MRIAVIGASGVLGRHLVPRLVERGHRVVAAVRRPEAAAGLAACGATARRADILDPDTLGPVLDGCEAVVHAATAVPRPGAPADWTLNDRIRREGTANLLAAGRAAGVRRYVQQGIAMVLSAADDRPQTEDDPVGGKATRASAVDMEALAAASGLAVCTVRGGAFYGPGTGREEDWRAQLRAGTLRLPGDGSTWISPIHVADMARAMVWAVEAVAAPALLNAVDDEPLRYRDLFAFLAAVEGVPAPDPGGPPGLPSFRVSNARLRALGWTPAYPSWRSGLAG